MARRSGRLVVLLAAGAVAAGWLRCPLADVFVGGWAPASRRGELLGRAATKQATKKATEQEPVDLEQPKRPASSYMLWLSENRAKIAKKVGGNGIAEVGKAAGEAWGLLTPKAKAPFEKKAAEAKEAYLKELEAFKVAGGVVVSRKAKKSTTVKKTRDPNKPKAPVGGAYMIWLSKNRETIAKTLPKGHKVTDVSKAAGVQWRALDAKKKQPFEKEYEKKRKEYLKAMESYVPPEN